MKFELYHHFHMILVENEEITADIKPLASFKHSVKYWWTKPKSQSEEVCYYHFWELINDQWYFLSVFFFPAFGSIKMKVSIGGNHFGSNLKANLRGDTLHWKVDVTGTNHCDTLTRENIHWLDLSSFGQKNDTLVLFLQ